MKNAEFLFFDVGYTLSDETAVWEERARLHAATSEAAARGLCASDIFKAFERASARREAPYHGAMAELGLAERFPYRSDLESVYPEAGDVLKRLSERFKLGVIANQQPGLRDRLREMRLLSFFSVVISSEDYPFRKPDLRLFREGLRAAGVAAQKAVMIGDRIDNDVLPAKALGMGTVRVLQGLGTLQTPETDADTPDCTVNSLRELIPIFL